MVPILSKEGKGGYNEKDVILNFYTPAGKLTSSKILQIK